MTSRWPLTPRGTGAVVLALVFLVLANTLGVGELVYFAVLLAAMVAASILTLYLVRRTETVARSVEPEVPAVGRAARVTVRVGIRPTVPTAAGGWRDALPRTIRGDAAGGFPAVAGRGRLRQVDLSYEMRPQRRGVQRIGPLTVVIGDPFGLARRARTLGERTTVTVAPAVVELVSLPPAVGDSGGRADATDQLGQGSDNLIARPWASGDSMRRIHWRATAHRGELMVRQEERESTPEAVVVLDRSAPRWADAAAGAPGADAGFEQAVTACVSAVARLVADGYAVAVIDSDGSPFGEPIDAGDLVGLDRLVSSFATVTTRPGEHLALAARWLTGGVTGPVVMVTGILHEDDAPALAPIVVHSSLPVLLAVDPVGDALDRCATTGWRTAAIGARADLAVAWSRVAEAEGAHV